MRIAWRKPLLLAAIWLMVGFSSSWAGSALWLAAPSSSDWNAAGNWTPGGPPNGAGDTALFQFSSRTGIAISDDTLLNGIVFQPGASSYSVSAEPNLRLTLAGSGITNASGITQSFLARAGGLIAFINGASAGTGSSFISEGGNLSGGGFGTVEFRNQASAAQASFTTNGGAVAGTFGAVTQFFDDSTAGNATFVNNGPTVAGAGRGVTLFFDRSNGASGTFINNGGSISGGLASFTFFYGNANAGNGSFTNNGGGALSAEGGSTQFFDTASAGHGTFIVNGGAASGGLGGTMSFQDSASADNGTFIVNGGTISGEFGGTIRFRDNSSAGDGRFTTLGAAVFDAGIGRTEFFDVSSAGNAAFTTSNGGETTFHDNSTAGSATFTINGGGVSGPFAGFMSFRDNSSAENGTFIIGGGAVEGAGGGILTFNETSTAGNATLIANGGINGGEGALIEFGPFNSSGGTARVEVFGTARLDVSGQSDPTLIVPGPGLTIGSLEGTGLAFLGSNKLTIGSNDRSTVFSGLIRGGGIQGGTGGSIGKIGAGTLTLTGENSFTGGLTISDGILEAGSRGALGVGDVLVTGGILQTSDGPRTVAVSGDYTQQSAGTLRIGIGGLAPAQHDLFSIAGTTNLSGALQIIRLNNFTFQRGDRVVILTADGGVNGVFAPVENPFAMSGTILQINVIYEPNSVVLEAVQGSFAALVGSTPNHRAIGANLNRTIDDPRAAGLINFLDREPLRNLPNDLDLIAPEELASIYEIGFSQAATQGMNLQRRLDDIRSGSNGFSAAGFAPRVSGKEESRHGTIAPVAAFLPSPQNRWGIFLTGTGEFVNVGDDFNARGYDIVTGGFTLGLDYRVSANFAVGLNAGYARSEADLVDRGRVTVDGGKLGFFATYFSGGFYLDGIVGGGFNNYETRRAALLGQARGTTSGGEFNTLVGTGFDWKCRGWRFGPTATWQYATVGFDRFNEKGSLAPLHLADQSQDSLRSTAGVRLAYECRAGRVLVKPEVRAGWQHEFADTAYPIESRFASGAGRSLTVRGPKLGRDSALLGAGVGVQWSERFTTYLSYEGQVGRRNSDAHRIGGGVGISF